VTKETMTDKSYNTYELFDTYLIHSCFKWWFNVTLWQWYFSFWKRFSFSFYNFLQL